MRAVPVAGVALLLLGVMLVALGLFAGGSLPIMVLGIAALVAGGVLQVAATRR